MPSPRSLAAGLAAAVALAAPLTADAATITVTTTADAIAADGACSLREAVIAANADAAGPGAGECAAGAPGGTDRIVLGAGLHRRSLAGMGEDAGAAGDLDVTGPLEILGAGAAVTVIDAAGIDRVIDVRPGGALRLADVTVTGGVAGDGASAPPAAAEPGVTTPVEAGNGQDGQEGGGVRAAGPLTLERARVTNNAGGRGGDGGDAKGGTGVSTSTPGGAGTGGDAGRGGAGAVWSGGGLTVLSSVISGNRGGAGGAGGAGQGGTGVGGAQAAPGGPGAGGDGGDGGAGAIAAAGVVIVRDSAVLGNQSGAGGAGGDGNGGPAGPGSDEPDAAGGAGTGGVGGDGGPGGGIDATGPVTLERTTVASNTTGRGGEGGSGLGGFRAGEGQLGAGVGGAGGRGGAGGGLVARANSLTLLNVTIAGNISGAGGGGGGGGFGARLGPGSAGGAGGAGGPGGGLSVQGGTASGTFVTIAGNGAGGPGGPGESGAASGAPGASGAAGGPGSGAGAAIAGAVPVSVATSVIANNGCTGAGAVDGGANVAFAAPGCPGAPGDPLLGALATNGGVPPTLQPGPGSAAIDRVPPFVTCPSTDARGALRPGGAGCDAGAYEVAPPVATTGAVTVTGTTARIGGTVATRGLATAVRVQIGRTPSYGTDTPPLTLAGDAAPTAVAVTVGGLAPRTTYHYRLVATGPDGTSVGADRTFTSTPPSTAGVARPRLTGLTVRPRAFAPVPRGGARTAPRAGRPALGAVVAFRLSERATVSVAVTRDLPGRLVRAGKRIRCRPLPAGGRAAEGARCVRFQTLGAVRRPGRAGVNRLVLTGNVGPTPLAPGRYRLTLVATDRDGLRSAPARAAIRILPAPPPPARRSATGG